MSFLIFINDVTTMNRPEQNAPPIEHHNTPATLTGLNVMYGNSELTIGAIGIARPEVFLEDSVSIVVGNTQGRDSATGNPYPYRYDADTEVTRIVDVHGVPLFETNDGQTCQARYAALGWDTDLSSGERVRTAVPLVPGVQHVITDRNTVVLGWYEITEASGLYVVRNDEHAPWTDVRIVGESNSVDDYVLQPPLVSAKPIQLKILAMAQAVAAYEPINEGDLMLEAGSHAVATDAITGQAVGYALRHTLVIPNGQPGRFEARTATILRQRQQFIDTVWVRRAAPNV
jgi:hypothetical protein